MPGSSVLYFLPEFAQIHVCWVSGAVYPSHPLLSSSLFAFSLSQHQKFFNESALHIKYWSFNFSYSSSSDYSGWFPLGLTGLISLQSKGFSKESSLTPQLKSINSLAFSLLYGPALTSNTTTRKTITLSVWTFVGKVRSLIFNMLSRFITAFLPRSKCLFMDAVTVHSDFGAQENKTCHCSHFFSFYLPWSVGTKHYDPSFLFLMLVFNPSFSLFYPHQEAL